MNATSGIDAVITWVDGNDLVHRRKLQDFLRASGNARMAAAEPTRFSDCGEIDYCVASLLRFAPWLRTIHIVTDAQTPSLMARLEGTPYEQRVRVVDHRGIFAGFEQYLPTFSNRAIECLLWRIPGIADRFLYLNDDFQVIRPVSADAFFRDDAIVLRGKWRASHGRRLSTRLRSALSGSSHPRGDVASTARPGNHVAQELSAQMAGFAEKYFQAPHLPHPMRRSTMERYFASHPRQLEDNLRHRLRATDQFLTTSLAAHLEFAAGTAIVDNSLRTLRLKPATQWLATLRRQTRKADMDAAVAFACVQSIDLASDKARSLLFDWLDRRVGKLADIATQMPRG